MDKIEELLIVYRAEKKLLKETKRFLVAVILLIIVVIEYGLIALAYAQFFWQFIFISILGTGTIKVLGDVYNGTFGLASWKEDYRKYQRKLFSTNQKKVGLFDKKDGNDKPASI